MCLYAASGYEWELPGRRDARIWGPMREVPA